MNADIGEMYYGDEEIRAAERRGERLVYPQGDDRIPDFIRDKVKRQELQDRTRTVLNIGKRKRFC